jgi:hypothetical protein
VLDAGLEMMLMNMFIDRKAKEKKILSLETYPGNRTNA